MHGVPFLLLVLLFGATSMRAQAADASGNPVEGFTITLDSLWGRVLAARERGELNSAGFDRNGVPVAINYGPWEVDGGVAFWVRNFVRRR